MSLKWNAEVDYSMEFHKSVIEEANRHLGALSERVFILEKKNKEQARLLEQISLKDEEHHNEKVQLLEKIALKDQEIALKDQEIALKSKEYQVWQAHLNKCTIFLFNKVCLLTAFNDLNMGVSILLHIGVYI